MQTFVESGALHPACEIQSEKIQLQPFIESDQGAPLPAPRVTRRRRAATHCNTLRHIATHCNALQYTAAYCNTPARQATRTRRARATVCQQTHFEPRNTKCNTLQHVATRCNTPARRATRRRRGHVQQRVSRLVSNHATQNATHTATR